MLVDILYEMMKILLHSLLFITIACGGNSVKSTPKTALNSEVDNSKLVKGNVEHVRVANKGVIKRGDVIKVDFKSSGDSIAIVYDTQRVVSDKKSGVLEFKSAANSSIGRNVYTVEFYKGGEVKSANYSFKLHPSQPPKQYGIEVVEALSRPIENYTQGLEFYNGLLYESSGLYGVSFVNYSSFPQLKEIKREYLLPDFFAEGLTILNDKLYLLSWQENTCFVLNPETLKIENKFRYESEGWGLTNDGEYLYMSDGSSEIKVLDPDTFKEVRRFEVLASSGVIDSINELEWIDGEIWANVYGYDAILKIDPQSGAVTSIISVPQLLTNADIKSDTDVLNGIALDPQSKKIYITGKKWPKMFAIKLIEK